MQQYGVRDVEKMLRLPRSTIRALAAAGFVKPSRGPRNALQFSFQDLIVMRTAQALADARVPARRIARSLKTLRRQLPEAMPLSGLSISAEGEQVVVRDRSGRRQVESGQYLLAFEGDPDNGSLSAIEPARHAPAAPRTDWFDQAVALERADADAAAQAYRRAIAADPGRLDARINLGRLLQEGGRRPEAERVYLEALDACGPDALVLYNLGVLLGDLGRKREAVAAYEAALQVDDGMADSHYNLGLLYRELGQLQRAIRHMAHYRRLTRG